MNDPTDQPPRPPVLVSACLLGLRTRHDGRHCLCQELVELAGSHTLVPVCPEQLGGLPTPRPAAEITAHCGIEVLDGTERVLDIAGQDVTEHFVRGAELTAEIAALVGAHWAILKEGSPSCGVRRIRRAGADVPGEGVTAALLRQRGMQLEGRD